MPLRRRRAPVDPLVVARLAAVLPSGTAGVTGAVEQDARTGAGWVPAASPAQQRQVPAGRARHAAGPTPRTSPAPPLRPVASAEAELGPPPEVHTAANPEPEPYGDVVEEDVVDADRTARVRPGSPTTLDRWRQGRLDPGGRGLAALVLVALLAAGLAAVVVLRARPHTVTPPAVTAPSVVASGVPVPGSSAAAPSVAGASGGASGGEVVVAVGGKVPRPGLLRLPAGSRVDDALRAAGGALPGVDLTDLNLARRLVDGEQLLVGVPPPPGGPAPGIATPGTGAAADGLVDLNTATVAQFDTLPGIGPVLAQKLVDWRTEHGRYGSVDQLREVGGIGESKYAEIKDKVRV